MTPSMDEPLSGRHHSRLEPRSEQMNLNDQEERDKNYSVTQEVKEMHKGMIHQINTTNTMEMLNSTIMKIIVTQKKVSPTNLSDDQSNQDGTPRMLTNARGGTGGIFGSSVLINGVAMQSSKKGSPTGNMNAQTRLGRTTTVKR